MEVGGSQSGYVVVQSALVVAHAPPVPTPYLISFGRLSNLDLFVSVWSVAGVCVHHFQQQGISTCRLVLLGLFQAPCSEFLPLFLSADIRLPLMGLI